MTYEGALRWVYLAFQRAFLENDFRNDFLEIS
jgi:hypothetical protein